MTPPHILAGGSVDNAAPTTIIEIVERLEDSFPSMEWNRPTCEGKSGDAVLYYGGMRTATEEGPVIPRPPDLPPAPMLGVNLPQPPAPMTPPPAMPLEPAIPPAPTMPEDLVSPPPPPSPESDTVSDAAVLDMGF